MINLIDSSEETQSTIIDPTKVQVYEIKKEPTPSYDLNKLINNDLRRLHKAQKRSHRAIMFSKHNRV